MDTTADHAPTPEPQQPDVQHQAHTEEKEKKSSKTALVIVLTVCILLIFGMAGYIVFLQSSKPLPQTTLPTPTAPLMPTTYQPPVSSGTPSASGTNAPPSVVPTKKQLSPNPDGNTFTSDTLGIAFYYGKTMGYDKNTTIKLLDGKTKVYLYESSMQPTTGQSIERFDKSPTDTLAQAITKKFLTGIPTTDCFVKIDPKKPSPTITLATISYPIPENADQPNFTYGGKCPEGYSESNGVAYFLEDSAYPDRFYYVSIGQYGIPAYNSKPDSMWQDTITVF